jgi:hypothetical protein
MKNVIYLILAIIFFALAYYVYWIVAQENGIAPTTRGVAPRNVGPPPSELVRFVREWQPVLTLLSSLGGIISAFLQVRVWVRARAG